MTETRKFDDVTHWEVWDSDDGTVGWSPVGWALPGDPSRYISRDDAAWGIVLDKARIAYGDPNMRYNTDDIYQDRHLVFGDGTRVPADGSLAYRDTAINKTYLLHADGLGGAEVVDTPCNASPPTNADCLESVTKIGQNFRIVAWFEHNGAGHGAF